MNDCPFSEGGTVRALEGYSSELFVILVESFWEWSEKGISPGLRPVGKGALNPLVVEAWRRIAAAEGRKRNRDRNRAATKGAADAMGR